MEKVNIGASSLTKDQLEMLMPDENIINDIDVIRQNAKDIVSENTNEKDIDSVLRKYNNIISILGGRGSGKTSVLLTIQEYLKGNIPNLNKKYEGNKEENQEKQDINIKYKNLFLSLIKPDCISNKCKSDDDVIGWLIGGFRKAVEQIEKDIYDAKKYVFDTNNKDYFEHCRKRDDNKLRTLYNELVKFYLYTKRDYQDVIKNEYEDFTSYTDNVSNSIDSQQRLIYKFYQFINEFVLIMRKCKENDDEPLLFFFFDDIELSEERCGEIINTIAKYLFHPNIVVFVAGDITQFEQRIVIDLLKKDNLINCIKEKSNSLSYIDEEINPNEILIHSKLLAKDILKKVMPPALRKYLQQIKLESRCEFIYNGKNTFGELLYEVFFENSMKKLSKSTKTKRINDMVSRGLLVKNSSFSVPQISQVFFNIFDYTPRGLINVCYLLSTFLEGKKDVDRKIIHQFVETIIKSSKSFLANEKLIGELLEEDKSDEIYKFNYDKLLVAHYANTNKEEYKEIYILMIFVENIISMIYPRELQGNKIANQLFNTNTFGFKAYPEIKNSNIIIQMYIKIREINNLNYNIYDNYKANYPLLEYFNVLEEIARNNNKSLIDFLKEIGNEDVEWLKEKCEIICSQSLEKYHIMSNIISEVKQKCLKMKADNQFLRELNEYLNNIFKFLTVEDVDNKYEEFDDKMLIEISSLLEKRSDFESGSKLYDSLESKIISHLYLFSTNSMVIYYINDDIKRALHSIINNNVNRILISGILKQLNDYLEKRSLNQFEYNDIINQINYNISLQPKASVFNDIKNILNNCPWVYEYQGEYDVKRNVEDFVIYILINYFRYDSYDIGKKNINYYKEIFYQYKFNEKIIDYYKKLSSSYNIDKKRKDYYEKFKQLYEEIIKNTSMSFIREYIKLYRNNYRVII